MAQPTTLGEPRAQGAEGGAGMTTAEGGAGMTTVHYRAAWELPAAGEGAVPAHGMQHQQGTRPYPHGVAHGHLEVWQSCSKQESSGNLILSTLHTYIHHSFITF